MQTVIGWIIWLQEQLPDKGFLVTTAVFLLLPWAVERLRGWLMPSLKPVRRQRFSLWVALVVAVVALGFLFVLVGMTVWSMAGDVFQRLPWPPGTTDEKGIGVLVLGVIAFVSFVTGMVYRGIRWERVEASGDSVAAPSNTGGADSEQLAGGDARQTSTGRGAGNVAQSPGTPPTGPIKT
jgi:membrane protease YdiL (CAAX protease family)